MRRAMMVCSIALALVLTACQDITAPVPVDAPDPAFVVTVNPQTGPSNQCYGDIVAGIASTWPWAHEDKAAFEPPPGAIALWLEIFGPILNISSVRELQALFCTPA